MKPFPGTVHAALAAGAALWLSIASFTPARAQIEAAGELYVDLSAEDVSAGEPFWTNAGTLGDFEKVGEPFLEVVDGSAAVTFNTSGVTFDAYQCADNAPLGLVGLDPTRSIEVWVFNPDILDEETILSWGKRGGPAGTNMSFNYGLNGAFGAVGHWDFPDLGWGPIVPAASQWHHLAYTFDGATTRVYDNGYLASSETLGPGVINTFADTRITLAAQIQADGVTLEPVLPGILSLARVRIHDGVLTQAQLLSNFAEELPEFNVPRSLPVIFGDPASDELFEDEAEYVRTIGVRGLPHPAAVVSSPPGATLLAEDANDAFTYTLRYTLPDPRPVSFLVTIAATNSEGDAEAIWNVTVRGPPQPGVIEVAGELYVDLDAADPSAGTGLWANQGTLGGSFVETGDALAGTIASARGVTFNGTDDFYQSEVDAPEGLVGADPTRSIEVWAHNPGVASEETLVSWGKRGGGPGTNMSFNFGTHPLFGAVGHWDTPDIGWGASVPAAGQWHHLVYTYDGSTTRVYDNGILANSEVLGPGVINTHCCTKITLAAQIEGDGLTVTPGLRGSLSLGRVRVHDGVLRPIQITHNYNEERRTYFAPPAFAGAPAADRIFAGSLSYTAAFAVTGFPSPTVMLLEPAGAVLDRTASLSYSVRYGIPDPEPASFTVRVRATNENGMAETSWTVTFSPPPAPGDLEIAGELFVELDATNPTAGGDEWENTGTLNDFLKIGNPFVEEIEGVTAVTFNNGVTGDVYQCFDDAPEGLVGTDPTRSIEAWVYNPDVVAEETIVAWGKRGGPDGSNMSFNYGSHPLFGAVGHWGGDGPDLGWGGTPLAGAWHHLVYTYDGSTTRVYQDGGLANFEGLGNGTINTHPMTKITVANQLEPDGLTLNPALWGSLSIARLRIHDGALSSFQVQNNFLAERGDFPGTTPPEPEPLKVLPVHRYSFASDSSDSIGGAHGTPLGNVTFVDGEAVLNNNGTQNSNGGGISPPAIPPGAYIDLPNGIISALGNQATFEAWVTWNGPVTSSWQRIFDFGESSGGENSSVGAPGQFYIFATPRSGDETTRVGYRDGLPPIQGGSERSINARRFDTAIEHHVVVVWDGAQTRAALYINGQLVDRDNATHFVLSDILDINNWLGRSQWADPLFAGSYNEFRIYNYSLTEGQVIGNLEAGPDTINTGEEPVVFVRGDADSNSRIELTDGIRILNFLFTGVGAPPVCFDASDTDDNGRLELTDAVRVLNYLFTGVGAPPAVPRPSNALYLLTDCGEDVAQEDPDLGCATPATTCL